MTSFEPTLSVRRLTVLRGTNIVYDGFFHSGVNILSGENSSGKSTILAFLVYALGSDISDWSEHALRCDRSLVEVTLNGNIAVLSRAVSPKGQQPMDIFLGDMDQALRAAPARWLRFPYRSSLEKISFSQQLFGMLGLPELQTEVSGKITMHQLMRLHYSDQMSSVDSLFRDESFDSPALRDAVGRFLFGAYDNEIYRNQLAIKELKSRLETIGAALRSIYAVLPHDAPLTLDWVFGQHRALNERISELDARIESEETSLEITDEGLSLKPLETALANLREAQENIAAVDQNIESLELEHADSAIFIETLADKIASIEDSSSVAAEIEQVSYTHCPSCFSSLAALQMEGACHLCQQPFDHERLHARMLRQLASVRRQLKQSEQLQAERKSDLARLRLERDQHLSAWQASSENVTRLRSRPTSTGRDNLRRLYEEMGRLRQELSSLTERATLIEKLDQMSAEKQDAQAEISRLEDLNARHIAAESDRLSEGTRAVSDEILWFLHHDLPRQDTFEDAKAVRFSFERNKISVNGIEHFSASSKVYLKNSFVLGLLFAATTVSSFRHLRIAVIDTIEDKGIEPERSQNFQRQLYERSERANVDHQIIFATAMIDPLLDNERFVVGRKSTHSDRTLSLIN